MSMKEADARMRKASEAYARGRTQKAWAEYGAAAERYATLTEPDAALRQALALYTRVLLVVKNHAAGEVEDDLESGEALAASGRHPELERFAGLFAWLRGARARLDDDMEAADRHLERAAEILERVGGAVDHLELAKERARRHADAGEAAAAIAHLHQVMPRLADRPRLAIDALIMLADVEEERGEAAAALKALESAGSRAFDHELKRERWDVEDRIRRLKARHPGLADAGPET